MANMLDYLDWRGDLSMAKDPFNEVDNLILAELSYIPFNQYMPGADSGESVLLKDVGKAFFEDHPLEESAEEWNKSPQVLKAAMKMNRFKKMKLRWFVDEFDQENEQQLSIVTFELEDGTAYVAFRGTDGTLIGWKEDFNMAYLFDTPGQKRAAEYLNEHFMNYDRPIRLGGHSKGGNFAMYAGMFCDPAVREKILTIYSNDGPGFHDEVMATDSYRAAKDKIVSIIPESSVVGMLLENQLSHILVKSTEDGFKQHDPLSWRVKRTKFVRAPELSSSSALLDATLTQWLGTLDIKERKIFVDSLFDTIAASGAMTIEEMNSNPVKCYESWPGPAGTSSWRTCRRKWKASWMRSRSPEGTRKIRSRRNPWKKPRRNRNLPPPDGRPRLWNDRQRISPLPFLRHLTNGIVNSTMIPLQKRTVNSMRMCLQKT